MKISKLIDLLEGIDPETEIKIEFFNPETKETVIRAINDIEWKQTGYVIKARNY